MESFFTYICEHANHAHWFIFILLLLSGLNLPISEDIMILAGGAIASSCIPDHALRLYIWVFLGAYLSAWIAYWMGRLLGPRLYDIALFRTVVTPRRLNILRKYYAKFGVFTFIAGRFCPGGIRNALFMSSGLTKMPFYLFVLRDGLACLISSAVFFHIGYRFGENIDLLLHYYHRYTHWFIAVLSVLILIGFVLWYTYRSRTQ